LTVVAALSKHVRKLPATLRRSLTWDRGHEMAKHKSFTVDTNVKVYSVIRRALGSAAPMEIPTALGFETPASKLQASVASTV
jgi:hypothetical protein